MNIDSISIENQNVVEGLCLECHTAIAMSDEERGKMKERIYNIVKDKYCEQCGNPLYCEKKR